MKVKLLALSFGLLINNGPLIAMNADDAASSSAVTNDPHSDSSSSHREEKTLSRSARKTKPRRKHKPALPRDTEQSKDINNKEVAQAAPNSRPNPPLIFWDNCSDEEDAAEDTKRQSNAHRAVETVQIVDEVNARPASTPADEHVALNEPGDTTHNEHNTPPQDGLDDLFNNETLQNNPEDGAASHANPILNHDPIQKSYIKRVTSFIKKRYAVSAGVAAVAAWFTYTWWFAPAHLRTPEIDIDEADMNRARTIAAEQDCEDLAEFLDKEDLV